MHNLGDHSQRLYCSGSHSGSKQQFRKVGWTTVSCRRQISVQPLCENVAGPDIVMCRQVEMWKQWLSTRVARCIASDYLRQLASDAVRAQLSGTGGPA